MSEWTFSLSRLSAVQFRVTSAMVLLLAGPGVPQSSLWAQSAVSFRPTVRLQLPETAGAGFTARSRVSALANGGFVVGPITEVGRLAWFDAQGRFQRLSGRRGEGPGEFGLIQTVAGLPDGRVAVSDVRLSILQPASLLAEKQVSGREGRLLVPVGANLILQNKLIMPGGKDHPFVVWGTGLDSLRSIGDPFPSLAGDATFRRVALRSNRTVVVSPVTAYEFAILDVTSGGVRKVTPQAVRFPAMKLISADTRPPHLAKPYPRILGLNVRGQDTLVVLYAQAVDNWTASPPPNGASGREGGGVTPPQDMSKYMSFFFDLIDLRTGASLGHGRLDGTIMDFAGRDFAYSIGESTDGDLHLQLYRLDITTSPSRRGNRIGSWPPEEDLEEAVHCVCTPDQSAISA